MHQFSCVDGPRGTPRWWRADPIANTYLVYDGWRARVDVRDRAALRLGGVAPMPVSRALLDTVPEAPPISAPSIVGVGAAGPSASPIAATPWATPATPWEMPPLDDIIHGSRAGQPPGTQTVNNWNINARDTEDAFIRAQRQEREHAATKLSWF